MGINTANSSLTHRDSSRSGVPSSRNIEIKVMTTNQLPTAFGPSLFGRCAFSAAKATCVHLSFILYARNCVIPTAASVAIPLKVILDSKKNTDSS